METRGHRLQVLESFTRFDTLSAGCNHRWLNRILCEAHGAGCFLVVAARLAKISFGVLKFGY